MSVLPGKQPSCQFFIWSWELQLAVSFTARTALNVPVVTHPAMIQDQGEFHKMSFAVTNKNHLFSSVRVTMPQH